MWEQQSQQSPEETAGPGGGDNMLSSLLAGLLHQWEQHEQRSKDPNAAADRDASKGTVAAEPAGEGLGLSARGLTSIEAPGDEAESVTGEAPPEADSARVIAMPDVPASAVIEAGAMRNNDAPAAIDAVTETPACGVALPDDAAVCGESAADEFDEPPNPETGADTTVEAAFRLEGTNLQWQAEGLSGEVAEDTEPLEIKDEGFEPDPVAFGESAGASLTLASANPLSQDLLNSLLAQNDLEEVEDFPADAEAEDASLRVESAAPPVSQELLESLLAQSKAAEVEDLPADAEAEDSLPAVSEELLDTLLNQSKADDLSAVAEAEEASSELEPASPAVSQQLLESLLSQSSLEEVEEIPVEAEAEVASSGIELAPPAVSQQLLESLLSQGSLEEVEELLAEAEAEVAPPAVSQQLLESLLSQSSLEEVEEIPVEAEAEVASSGIELASPAMSQQLLESLLAQSSLEEIEDLAAETEAKDAPSALEPASPRVSQDLLESLLAQSDLEEADDLPADIQEEVASRPELASDRAAKVFAWDSAPAQEPHIWQRDTWAARDRKTPADASASRRESMLRLLAAMYPTAAPRITGQAVVEAAQSARRSAADGHVVFQLGSESFAVALRHVLEADRLPSITPVPFVPEFVRGVTNRRGDVLPLIDLRLLLGVDTGEQADGGRMLVVRRNETEPPAALIVDSLGGIAWFDRLVGGGTQSRFAGRYTELLSGAGEHRGSTVHILDVERLFARKEIEELTAA